MDPSGRPFLLLAGVSDFQIPGSQKAEFEEAYATAIEALVTEGPFQAFLAEIDGVGPREVRVARGVVVAVAPAMRTADYSPAALAFATAAVSLDAWEGLRILCEAQPSVDEVRLAAAGAVIAMFKELGIDHGGDLRRRLLKDADRMLLGWRQAPMALN